ncbi:hypothetical protein HAX54_011096 [Datura stramonium]|uniref:Uncharacterized protein n=1 Tax=Datura stramonium TaxID=4076 RepID=A0ABS8THB3_DATST|nr:hypothetical protein [Datura stramonium]
MTGRPVDVGVIIRDVFTQARVKRGRGFEEPFDDDPADDEKEHVESDLDSDTDEEEDSEMENFVYAPRTNDE